jgi:hypothetical protein
MGFLSGKPASTPGGSGGGGFFAGATNAQLETRVKALETKLAAHLALPTSDYSAQIAALVARMNAIEAKTCPQQAIIDDLVADHIPTP